VKAAKRSRQGTNAAPPNNLPRYLTSFVGRGGELIALKSLLENSRMITLAGPGGAGKSRLAAEFGHAFLDLWPGGAWWVALGSVSDPRHVPGAVVAALELPGQGPPQDAAIAWLSARRALLVVDDCEHLVAACALFCQAALELCPELTIITTSREALRVPGETLWAVASLPASDAVHLFEARARQLVPTFRVTESNLETVTTICGRLDRMPLAIELAAARVGMMTEAEILSQLSDRFHLLTVGSRTAPERQQTMGATIDWSYRLLSEGEAQLFRLLSVFRGGFEIDSVQALSGGDLEGRVLELLTGLVQKSMVVAEGAASSGTRYRLLESQLAYAEDRLRESGELDLMRRRHYEYFGESLHAKTGSWPGRRRAASEVAEAEWKLREWSNLWAAMEWAQYNADDRGIGLAIDLSFGSFGDIALLRGVLSQALDRFQDRGAMRVRALCQAAQLAIWHGDYDAAVRDAEAGLALARELGDREVLAWSLNTTQYALWEHGERDAAMALLEEARSLVQGLGDHSLATTIKNNFATTAIERGECASARDVLVECVAAARAAGDALGLASFLGSLAWARQGLNDYSTADADFKHSLAIVRRLMNRSEIIESLHGLSSVASATGNDQRAVRLAAAAGRLCEEWSLKAYRWAEAQVEDAVLHSRSKLGTHKSEEAWAQGRAMTVDQVIDYALGEGEPETAIDVSILSKREREVAILVANGLTNRQIADRLFIAERSAEGHLERIRSKLGVRSRAEVARWSVEHGLMAAPIKERGTRRGPLSTQRQHQD
jgi:predicted ATPase/DNA-binding CsgD family transcriptional regulator